jgi:hypothetical protein
LALILFRTIRQELQEFRGFAGVSRILSYREFFIAGRG